MLKTFKKILKKTIWHLGFEVRKINKEVLYMSFDDIYRAKIKVKSPVIFDIGANQGQSIERFKKIFPDANIYAFEPIKFEYEKLKEKYQNNNNITLINCALGEKSEFKDFFITAKTGNSSFNKVKSGTKWLETRSKQYNTTKNNYINKIEKVKIMTLDEYCSINQIQNIDLIKVDTQGYEDKVLEGSLEMLSKDAISVIESELMLDNVYEKYLNFSDLEKHLIPKNFRLVGINMINNNLFSGLTFFADVVYFNKNKFNL